MPVLKNPRHELYAEGLAKGLTQDTAYAEAGYKPNPHNASRLLNSNETIRNRVAELQSRNVEKQGLIGVVTTERLLAMAEEARVLAMQQNQPAAAVTALTALAKLSGRWVERSERTNIKGDLESMSDAELAAIVRQGQPEPVQPNHETDKKLN